MVSEMVRLRGGLSFFRIARAPPPLQAKPQEDWGAGLVVAAAKPPRKAWPVSPISLSDQLVRVGFPVPACTESALAARRPLPPVSVMYCDILGAFPAVIDFGTEAVCRLRPDRTICFTSTEARWLIRDGDRG